MARPPRIPTALVVAVAALGTCATTAAALCLQPARGGDASAASAGLTVDRGLLVVRSPYRVTARATLDDTKLTVRVTRRRGDDVRPVADASVRVEDRTATTDARGIARVTLAEVPSSTLTVRVTTRGVRPIVLRVRSRTA